MEYNFSDKVALVTGSSRGLGLEIAKFLSRQGCKVVINGRNSEALKRIIEYFPDGLYVAEDVSDLESSKRLVKEVINKYGKLDFLVCNVGSGQSVKAGEETYEEWQRVFGLNFWSATNVIESAKPYLANSLGSIVCISSICGIEYIPGAPLTYSVAKSALNSYVKGISKNFGSHGIRINAIAPGNINFIGSVWESKLKDDAKKVDEMLKNNVALGSLGSPEDIYNLTGYLLSSNSKFVTGAIWTIDGGQVRG